MIPRPRFIRAAIVTALVLLFAAATPAGAQQDVMRDVYGFFGSSLNVDVATEAPGRVRFIRGRRSRIEVAGRTPDGFTSAALGGEGVRRLTLTALGSGPVDFIVVVPENVRVRVSWQGSSRSELFGTLSESATYAWQAPRDRPAFETLGPGIRGDLDAGTHVAAGDVPRTLDIAQAHRLERLTVRIEGDRFSVRPERDLDVRRAGDHLDLAAPEHGDVTVFVPRGRSLTLRLDGSDAIVIDGDQVRVICDAVLSQTLPDGRRWLTLTPALGDGCGRPSTTLPPGATPADHRRT